MIINFQPKFIFTLKKIAPDKWKHFFVGIPLGIMLQFVSLYLFPLYPLISIAASFIILVAGCYAFELFSLITGKGHYELPDVLAGVLGGVIGIGAVLLLTK
jgi:VanZ family protein